MNETMFQLWTSDRAFVCTLNKDAAELFEQEGGRVTSSDCPEDYRETVLEADKSVAEWLSRYLAEKAQS